MNGNSLKKKANGSKIPAINPAQFPLGSTLSRAAARSMAQARAMSQDDADALALYRHIWLHADMVPNDRDLAATAIYARGKQIAAQAGEHWEDHYKFTTGSRAASSFALLFGRIPEPGDILRFSQLEYIPVITRHMQRELIAAWGRQFKDLPCPLRFQGDTLQKRTITRAKGHAMWVDYEFRDHIPERDWLVIQREANSDYVALAPSISAVYFLDDVHCRPATEREAEEDQTAPSGGLLGVVLKIHRRLKEEGVVA